MSKETSNDQLFEFMTKMYGEMQEGFKELRGEIQENRGLIQENRDEIRNINAKIEHEIMPKLDILFDGYKQNSDKLDRIEKEVSRHDEIILGRVK